MAAFMAGDFTEDDPDVENALAQAVQAHEVAYAAWGKVKGKGKTKNGKEKSKGKTKDGKGKNRPQLSVEDRKRRLQELKSRTNCQSCGQKGHWAGDACCPKNGTGSSSGSSAQPAGFTLMSVASSEEPIGPPDEGLYLKLIDEIDDDKAHSAVAFMHSHMPDRDPPDPTGARSSVPPPPTTTNTRPRKKDKAPDGPTESECMDGCKNFTRKGSSAYVMRETCIDCGCVHKTEKTPAVADPSRRLHERVDARGSTKYLVRTTCVDCHDVLAEHFREEAKAREHLGDTLKYAAPDLVEGVAKAALIRCNIMIDSQMFERVISDFALHSRQHVANAGSISSAHLSRMLDDLIDAVAFSEPARQTAAPAADAFAAVAMALPVRAEPSDPSCSRACAGTPFSGSTSSINSCGSA
jgi:hypothetical protein